MEIRFTKEQSQYGAFSNFHQAAFTLDGKVWPTTEHYFQAQKFMGGEHEENVERVRQATSPAQARRLGRSLPGMRKDWKEVRDSVMRRGVYAKFSQNPAQRELLLSTELATLKEEASWNSYWGTGSDGRGKNKLGWILMSTRARIRAELETPSRFFDKPAAAEETVSSASPAVSADPVPMAEEVRDESEWEAPAEAEFHAAILSLYDRAFEECGYRATAFKRMVLRWGGLEAACRLLNGSDASFATGLSRLAELDRLDLSVEALIVKSKWEELFTETEIATARDRLATLERP